MHYRTVVIWSVEVLSVHSVKVSLFARLYVLKSDAHIFVSVTPLVFVMEAQSMQELMLDGAKPQTPLTLEGYQLLTALTTNKGATAIARIYMQVVSFRLTGSEADARGRLD